MFFLSQHGIFELQNSRCSENKQNDSQFSNFQVVRADIINVDFVWFTIEPENFMLDFLFPFSLYLSYKKL